MADEEIERLLAQYSPDEASPFAMSPAPPADAPGYGARDYPRDLMPLDIARAMGPPGSGAGEKRSLGEQAKAQRGERWSASPLALVTGLLGPRVPARLPLSAPKFAPPPSSGGVSLAEEQLARAQAPGLPNQGFKLTREQLERAQAEGFGPTVYYQGRETPYPGRREFQFVTEDPRMASWFADTSDARKGTTGGHVMPLLVNRSGFADLTSPADLARIAKKLTSRTSQLRPGMSDREALDIAHAWLQDPKNIIDGRVNWAVSEPFLGAAKEAGFHGMPVHETWGKWGANDSHSLAVFDRSRLRSPMAKFDPASRGSDNPLASVAGTAIGASALADLLSQYDKPDPVSP